MMDESDSSTFVFLVRIAWKCGTVICGLTAIAVGFLYVKQDSLLYFPEIGGMPRRPGQNPKRYRSPAEHQVPYETHMIRCEDGISIHSWLLLHPHSRSEKCPTIVFFHGNAGNIGLRLPNAIQMFTYLNANILMVEYRGYGDSDDAMPSEQGLRLDAEAALNFLTTHASIDASRIFLFGRSLGGAVAFHLAHYAQTKGIPLAGVMVENTFLSIAHMVDHLMPYVAPLKFIVLKIGWDSSLLAPKLKMPILYLAGAADELVPHFHMKELHKVSGNVSRLHVVHDGTHNDTWIKGGRAYYERLKLFMNDAIESIQSVREGMGVRSSSMMNDDSGAPTGHDGLSVGMGGEAAMNEAAIPIMPSNIIGMTREARVNVASTSSGETGLKKKAA
eukprot:scaffold178833_cov47-Attheya_sp.AAC.2